MSIQTVAPPETASTSAILSAMFSGPMPPAKPVYLLGNGGGKLSVAIPRRDDGSAESADRAVQFRDAEWRGRQGEIQLHAVEARREFADIGDASHEFAHRAAADVQRDRDDAFEFGNDDFDLGACRVAGILVFGRA
jgi:hypothetical protein